MWDLEDILHYSMNEDEAKSYKISLLWMELAHHEFPDYEHTKLRKKGDPRKSILFKYCYKLVQETRGIIADHEYRLYILAQLQILKYLAVTKEHALIDPIILIGDKAWKRWQVWRSKYAKRKRETVTLVEPVTVTAPNTTVVKDLRHTKDHFIKKFGGCPNFSQVEQALKDHTMVRWVTMDRVSPYYILLSPWVARCMDGRTFVEVFMFDLVVYENSITQPVREFFKQEFAYEYV